MVKLKSKSEKMSPLMKRILASAVMLPVVIGSMWAGYPYIELLALGVGTLLCREWEGMIKSRTPTVYVAAYIFALAVSLLVYSTAAVAGVIVLVSLLVWLKAAREEHRALLTLGVPYISIGVGSLLWIYHDAFAYHPYNFYMTLWFFLMVWAMDSGGLIVGCSVKGPKLAPKISPNKTWSGLIGGIVFAVAASIIYFYLLSLGKIVRIDAGAQTVFAVLGGIIAAVSQVGDLIESAIKRRLGIKDSGNLIPGHGGIFDRIDGLIFAAPFVYWLFIYGLWYF